MTQDELRARFQKALHWGGDTHSIADVIALADQHKVKFWHNDDGCIVTELHRFPQLTTVNYWLISGELRACLALEEQINADAIAEGATVATATGRKGWGRVAAPTGWRPHLHTFWKRL